MSKQAKKQRSKIPETPRMSGEAESPGDLAHECSSGEAESPGYLAHERRSGVSTIAGPAWGIILFRSCVGPAV